MNRSSTGLVSFGPAGNFPLVSWFQMLLTAYLVLQVLLLMKPDEFRIIFEYPGWFDGILLCAGLGPLILTLFPATSRFQKAIFFGAVPLGMVVSQFLLIMGRGGLPAWIFLLVMPSLWIIWATEIIFVRCFPRTASIVWVGNFLPMLYLYADWHFYFITNAHLAWPHFWMLQFPVVITLSPDLIREAVLRCLGVFFGITAFGFAWKRHLVLGRPPLKVIGAMLLAMICWYECFDHFLGNRSFPEYLSLRVGLSMFPLPEPRSFRIPPIDAAFRRHQDLDFTKILDPVRISGSLASHSSPNLVFIVIESWRGDSLETGMPLLRARIPQGVWLKNHHSAANGTQLGNYSLFHGKLPLRYRAQKREYPGLPPSPWLEFLRRSGYRLERLTFDEFPFASVPTTTFQAPENMWETTPKILQTLLERLREPGPHCLLGFLFSTHFNYYYPPEFEKFRPTIPPNLEFYLLNADESAIAGIRNRYRNALLYLDSQLDLFFREAEKQGLASNTIFILTGDHGEALGENNGFTHTSGPNLVQFWVPAVIFAPRLPPRIETEATHHVDLLPTVFHQLNLRWENAHGKDLSVSPNRKALLCFDESAEDHLILRREDRMSIFHLNRANQLHWLVTTDNENNFPERLFSLYSPKSAASLTEIILADRKEALSILGVPSANQ